MNYQPKANANAKENNRHAYGKGNGKLGKKSDRIKRALQRAKDNEAANPSS